MFDISPELLTRIDDMIAKFVSGNEELLTATAKRLNELGYAVIVVNKNGELEYKPV